MILFLFLSNLSIKTGKSGPSKTKEKTIIRLQRHAYLIRLLIFCLIYLQAYDDHQVRKEKLGDRITTLHQLVSPFGKTDTASVLLEAIGYIRFLQSQIEVMFLLFIYFYKQPRGAQLARDCNALSLPYLGSGSGNMRQQQAVQGERNCIFPEDPGQLLNDNCVKAGKGASEQESHEEAKKDLKSRGLCLVPVSCTLQVGSDNGADYWAPALGGGFR